MFDFRHSIPTPRATQLDICVDIAPGCEPLRLLQASLEKSPSISMFAVWARALCIFFCIKRASRRRYVSIQCVKKQVLLGGGNVEISSRWNLKKKMKMDGHIITLAQWDHRCNRAHSFWIRIIYCLYSLWAVLLVSLVCYRSRAIPTPKFGRSFWSACPSYWWLADFYPVPLISCDAEHFQAAVDFNTLCWYAIGRLRHFNFKRVPARWCIRPIAQCYPSLQVQLARAKSTQATQVKRVGIRGLDRAHHLMMRCCAFNLPQITVLIH